MIAPATALALQDRRLKRRDLQIYGLALQTLSFYEPRPFKVAWVARQSAVYPGYASMAIRRLVRLGYLERGPRHGHLHTYLLRGTLDQLAA